MLAVFGLKMQSGVAEHLIEFGAIGISEKEQPGLRDAWATEIQS